jgi:hypothetical protein
MLSQVPKAGPGAPIFVLNGRWKGNCRSHAAALLGMTTFRRVERNYQSVRVRSSLRFAGR